jgi:uncharacterized membrane protein
LSLLAVMQYVFRPGNAGALHAIVLVCAAAVAFGSSLLGLVLVWRDEKRRLRTIVASAVMALGWLLICAGLVLRNAL